MSSTLAGATIQANQTALIYDRAVSGRSAFQPMVVVPLGDPARIEAVWLNAAFSGIAVTQETFVVSFNQADGSTIYTQQGPIIGTGIGSEIVCCFARGNVESGQVLANTEFPIEVDVATFIGPPLPDVVLPALCTVNLALLELSASTMGACTVSPYAVTYTPGTGPTSQTAGVQGIPLLTATDGG